MTWQTIRTLTTQAAEAGVPTSTLFVAHPDAGQYSQSGGRIPYVEVGFDSLVLAGSPTAVTLAVWRLSDAKVERLLTTTIPAAEIGSPIPLDVEVDAEALWVTVDSFTGGTAPTLDGVIRYRPSRSGASRPVPTSVAVTGALYSASPATRVEAKVGPLQQDLAGNLCVTVATDIAGEDRSNTRLRVYSPNGYTHLAANATTTIKSGAGTLRGVTVGTKGATGNTLTLYDNTAGSGTVIGVIDTTREQPFYPFDVQFTTGLTVVIATGTAADVTVASF
jgi:hypothetical protein